MLFFFTLVCSYGMLYKSRKQETKIAICSLGYKSYKCVEWGAGMDSKFTDLRTRRTYKFLTDALFELIAERPFEEISVTDICNKAMVHRTTFYKHFEDKYQLLRVSFLAEKKTFADMCKDEVADGSDPNLYYTRLIRLMFEYVSKKKDLFRLVIFQTHNNCMTDLLQDTIVSYLNDHFKQDTLKYNIHYKVPIPMMAEYFAGAAIAMAVWWLENDMKISIDQMVDYMNFIISNDTNTNEEMVVPNNNCVLP